MSTSVQPRNTSFTLRAACALLLAASTAGCGERSVSYAGLDAPTVDPATLRVDTGGILVGAFATLSGGTTLAGQEFEQSLRAAIADIDAHGGVQGRVLELALFDDCGTDGGARSAGERLEDVHRAVVVFAGPDPLRAAAAARAAPDTPFVFVGATAAALPRAGTFTLVPRDRAEAAAVTKTAVEWIAAAFARAKTYGATDVLVALRTTRAPSGWTLAEGGVTRKE